MATQASEKKPFSYSEVAKLPKVGKKPVSLRDPEKCVLVYPADESKTDSEETKKVLKSTLAPKSEEIQVRAVRKVQKGGIAVETGSKSAAIKIKELTMKVPTLGIAAAKVINPRVLI